MNPLRIAEQLRTDYLQLLTTTSLRGAIAYIPSNAKKWDPNGPYQPPEKKRSAAGTRAERANPNPVSSDYAERPGKIRLRLNQGQGQFRSVFRGIRRDAE